MPEVRAEMVANVWKVVTAEGEEVSDGSTLVILESMKMEIPVLAEGSGTAGPIFDEMVTQTEQWLARADEASPDPPAVDRRIRAALVTAMAAGIPLLHDHLSRAIGADIFDSEGDRLLALGLLDIYSHKLIN